MNQTEEEMDKEILPEKLATTKKNYICINCGHPIDELYTKYSASVMKIANCVRIFTLNILNFCIFIEFDDFFFLGKMP